jgi:osmoprotectant transport system ATP-binding protein
MPENHSILLQNISQIYDKQEVLSDISLSFATISVTALLGKSGSGKSTLLQLINGMLKPSKGRVCVFGQDFSYEKANEIRLKIGYVVQQVGLFPHLNIFENISLLGKITKMPKDEMQARVNSLMNTVQLSLEYLQKYPHELSGGEQQRVGLCRALFLKPAILLMDEPFAALDYATKNAIYQYFLLLQKSEPCTVVFVTHDFNEAMTLADEYVWLENGKIRSKGTKSELLLIKEAYQSA